MVVVKLFHDGKKLPFPILNSTSVEIKAKTHVSPPSQSKSYHNQFFIPHRNRNSSYDIGTLV